MTVPVSRITLYQGRPCATIPPRFLASIRAARPHILCLPEYFWSPAAARSQRDVLAFAALAKRSAAALSRELDCVVVAGTMVVEDGGKIFNECPIYHSGNLCGTQRKRYPTERERQHGVAAGDGYAAIDAGGRHIGVLVCADVLEPEAFATMHELGVDLIVAPTLSPYRATDSVVDKATRDREIFAAGAVVAAATVAKVCGVGRVYGSGRLQGRSLVVSADGRVLRRVPPESEGRVKIITVEA